MAVLELSAMLISMIRHYKCRVGLVVTVDLLNGNHETIGKFLSALSFENAVFELTARLNLDLLVLELILEGHPSVLDDELLLIRPFRHHWKHRRIRQISKVATVLVYSNLVHLLRHNW